MLASLPLLSSWRKLFGLSIQKKQGNRLLIDPAGERIIKAHFKDSAHVKSKTNQKDADNLAKSDRKAIDNDSLLKSKDETIELLKKQLATKDEQLKRRADELASMHKLMDQNQQLLLNTQEENKRLLALQAPTEDLSKPQEGEFKEKTATHHLRNKSQQKSRQTRKRPPLNLGGISGS